MRAEQCLEQAATKPEQQKSHSLGSDVNDCRTLEMGKFLSCGEVMEFSSLLLTPGEMVGLILQTVHRELLRDALLTKTVFGHFLQKMLPRVSCGISCQSSTF